MATRAELKVRYRFFTIAIMVSAAIHAAVLIGMPARIDAIDHRVEAIYSATLEPIAAVVTAPPAPAPVAVAPRPPKPKKRKPPPPVPAPESVADGPPEAVAEAPAEPPAVVAAAEPGAAPPEPEPEPPREPEQVALAQPATPSPALEPEKFPVEALPPKVSISYKLTSAFADGRAEYRWERDGDRYTISGEAEAEGFFTLFLEGRVTQESSGSVTDRGLRPERFREQKPRGAPEGLEFDWDGRQVTQDRGEKKTVTALADNTVDWLSMIFQMAHRPPNAGPMEISVFTQRKLYRFQLEVLGMEEITIPLGTVRALHLRHTDPRDANDVVDVWLGVEQYYLPVKLRYPVARNRLMVEQAATEVVAR